MAALDSILTQIKSVDVDAEASISVFHRQYLQRLDVSLLKWPEEALLRIYDLQIWLYQTVEETMETRPHPSYDRRCLKALVSKIEMSVQDADEPVCYPE